MAMMPPEMESPAEDMGEEQGQPGYCIELYVNGDGTMSVSVESEAEEAEQHDGDPTGGGTPVQSLKEAIALIQTIIANGGQVSDAAADDEFAAGYGDGAMPETAMSKRFG